MPVSSKKQKVSSGVEESSGSPSNQWESPSPAEKVSGIYLLTKQILSYCNNKDLLKVRLISRKWMNCANEEIKRRDYLRLRFVYVENGASYKLILNNKNKNYSNKSNNYFQRTRGSFDITPYSLAALSQLLENPDTHFFPCDYFTFSGGNLKSGGAREFFYNYGHYITRMILTDVQPTEETFLSLLQFQALNLKKLSLSFKPDIKPKDWRPDQVVEDFHFPVSLDPLSLVSMETLHFGEKMMTRDWRSNVAIDLVRRSPNLKIVGNFPIVHFDLDFWKDLEKSYIFKEINLSSFQKLHLFPESDTLRRSAVRELGRFESMKPKVKILRLGKENLSLGAMLAMNNPTCVSISDSLYRIFGNSKETLQILDWGFLESSIPRISFQNVQKVSLQVGNHRHRQQFDVEKFIEMFPNAQSLTLSSPANSALRFNQVFFTSSDAKINSVKELKLSNNFILQSWNWKDFIEIFPNLEKLDYEKAYRKPSNFFATWPSLNVIEWMGLSIKRSELGTVYCVDKLPEPAYMDVFKTKFRLQEKWKEPEIFSM